MAERLSATTELLAEVPAQQREGIVSGMRWAVWLAALAVPFSYGTTALLARTSPEAIGTYGLLTVYLGLVTAFFYLGGDTVVVKFVPELEAEERLSFLISYFAVICAALLPWLAAAALWPGPLRYLFGQGSSARFQLLILCLSPIYILFCVVAAALKGMLEIRSAQLLLRLLTVGSFLIYAALFFGVRTVLATHYTTLIWAIYLGLVVVATALGLRRLLRLHGWEAGRKRTLHFFLPGGFWRYMLSNQQVSMVSFFIQRLDYVFLLNLAGLATLGKYVAITAIAAMIPMVNRYFLEALLPSLTNLAASRNPAAASEVFSLHLRILFLVNTVTTCGLMLLVDPLTTLLGSTYTPLRSLLVLLVLLVGLSEPGAVGGALLAAAGKLQRAVWIRVGQVGLFTVLLLGLWWRWQLLGAVLACGISTLISNACLLMVAKRSSPVRFSAGKDYVDFAVVASVIAAVACGAKPLGLSAALLLWTAAATLFLWLARYQAAECMRLLRCFVPGIGFLRIRRFMSTSARRGLPIAYLAKVAGAYLRGRAVAATNVIVLPGDVFIVSYPRSGNTWTRFLIANLMHPGECVSFANIEEFVPDIYTNSQAALLRVPSPRVLKSHETFDPRYKRVIYVVRDPRDVAVSLYHWEVKRRVLEDGYPMDRFGRPFMAGEFEGTAGSWGENVASWLATRSNGNRFLLLRYEDILAQPERQLRRIALFLGINSSDEQLARAIELSSADRMRTLEKKDSHIWIGTRKTRQDKPFVRSATPGTWRSELPTDLVQEIEEAWSPLMRALGYELSTDARRTKPLAGADLLWHTFSRSACDTNISD